MRQFLKKRALLAVLVFAVIALVGMAQPASAEPYVFTITTGTTTTVQPIGFVKGGGYQFIITMPSRGRQYVATAYNCGCGKIVWRIIATCWQEPTGLDQPPGLDLRLASASTTTSLK